jgi:HD-GYP domain-containing protein (c-di-GMP phosphodiesterase class II)
MEPIAVQASTAIQAESDDPVTLITASRRYQIGAAELQQGMFVAELDRPWLDTPFLLQGFVADSQVEIDTLRKYCSYVYVDLELSHPEVADEIRRSELRAGADTRAKGDAPAGRSAPFGRGAPAAPDTGPRSAPFGRGAPAAPAAPDTRPDSQPQAPPAGKPAAPPPTSRAARVYKARADVRISTDTRQKFRQFVRATAAPSVADGDEDGVLGRAMAWLKDRFGTPRSRQPVSGKARDRANVEAIKAWLPTEIKLTPYSEASLVQEELPRARISLVQSEDALKNLVSDVKVGKVPQVAQVAAAVDNMVESMISNPDALMWVGRLREEDVNTYNHGVKVALYMISLGRHLGFPKEELSNLGMIGMLADVGKIKLPRALLDKPGMLAAGEFGLIKEHVRLGLEAIREGGSLPVAVEQGIAQHHERLDGTGYPNALKGDEISIYGRIAAIADSFAALITPRAYANPSAPQDALMNLYEWAGSSFHEPLVEQFVQAVGVFPVGSLVELSSGEVAVVVAHNRVRRLEPRVLVLTWPDKSQLPTPIERDLLSHTGSTATRLRIQRGLPAGAYGLKLRDYYMGEIARANDLPA